jgi:NADH dehydrogenase FAD-containing subunit
VEYDRLIVTVGATTNTFNIPGVEEHCRFIKEVSDAKYIRTKLVNSLERAKVPGLSEEEIRRRLSIVIIGAGPAGVELAAELRDFIREDGPRYYCDLLPHVNIKLVEASGNILAPFEKELQEEAIHRLTGNVKCQCALKNSVDKLPEDFTPVELLLNSPVTEVTANTIKLKDGRVLDHSLAIWAGGIKPLPLTSDLIQSLGPAQQQEQDSARGRIAVDPWLRAIGGGGRVMALGDCAVNPERPLPPTGQVASQQGEFLAQLMNNNYELSTQPTSDNLLPPPANIPGETQESLEEKIAALATRHMEYAKPFQYLDLGILAYTGDHTALAQVKLAPSRPPILSKGKTGNFLWRSVYLAKQVSWRNRLLIMNDWLKQVWFGGRDISRF